MTPVAAEDGVVLLVVMSAYDFRRLCRSGAGLEEVEESAAVDAREDDRDMPSSPAWAGSTRSWSAGYRFDDTEPERLNGADPATTAPMTKRTGMTCRRSLRGRRRMVADLERPASLSEPAASPRSAGSTFAEAVGWRARAADIKIYEGRRTVIS